MKHKLSKGRRGKKHHLYILQSNTGENNSGKDRINHTNCSDSKQSKNSKEFKDL